MPIKTVNKLSLFHFFLLFQKLACNDCNNLEWLFLFQMFWNAIVAILWSSYSISFFHFYPSITGSDAFLGTNSHSLGSYPVTKLSSCCMKNCPDNLLLVLVPPSRDKYRKVSYPRTLQHDEGVGWTKTFQSWSSYQRLLKSLGHASNFYAQMFDESSTRWDANIK